VLDARREGEGDGGRARRADPRGRRAPRSPPRGVPGVVRPLAHLQGRARVNAASDLSLGRRGSSSRGAGTALPTERTPPPADERAEEGGPWGKPGFTHESEPEAKR